MTLLLPPSTMLIGAAGSGKTTSLVSLMECGLKLRMLATEPTAPNRVIEEMKKRNLPINMFDWKFISPAVPSWDALKESAKIINSMTLKQIAEMREGIAKPDSTRWLEMLESCHNFVSERTGESLGDVTEWGADCAFAFDGCTGMSTMARNLTVGLKPNPAPGEWGTMQHTVFNFVKKLTGDSKCFFTLITHIEREQDEITGLKNITVSTLGAKLAPKLPPEFTNVVYCKRIGKEFFWSTGDTGVDTKNGDLPLSSTLEPTFKPIVEAYRERLELVEEELKESPKLPELSALISSPPPT